MKRIIINNDDFGISSAINESVIVAYKRGILTSTTMIVEQEATDEAVEIAKSLPGLGVGIHLDMDRFFGLGKGNNFGCTLHEIDQDMYLKHTTEGCESIKREISNQLAKFQEYGLVPSHLDGHHFVHQFPRILPLVVEVMVDYGIDKIRFSRDFYLDHIEDFLKCKDLLDKAGIVYPDDFFDLDEELFGRTEPIGKVFRRVKDGVTEVMTHITLPQENELEWRARQFAYLTGDDVLGEIKDRGIVLISFRDL